MAGFRRTDSGNAGAGRRKRNIDSERQNDHDGQRESAWTSRLLPQRMAGDARVYVYLRLFYQTGMAYNETNGIPDAAQGAHI